MASVRAIVQGTLKNEDFLVPLEKALEKYGKDKAELVIGTATAVDTAANTVKVATADGGERTIAYDQLVLATGARTAEADMPWKASGSYEELTALLDGVREKVAKAKHIVVAGAGSTGVEAASELGFAHGKDKEIVLLCSGDKLLAGDSLASNAAAELKKLNVTVKYNAYVESATALPDGKTEIVLAGASGDDAKITTDLYLPTMGLAPNSDYLDAKFLNDKKYVVVDDVYRVKGLDNVWALGDVVSLPRAGFMITKTQVRGHFSSLHSTPNPPSPIPPSPSQAATCSHMRAGWRRRQEHPAGPCREAAPDGQAAARRRLHRGHGPEARRRPHRPRQGLLRPRVHGQGQVARHQHVPALHRRQRCLIPRRPCAARSVMACRREVSARVLGISFCVGRSCNTPGKEKRDSWANLGKFTPASREGEKGRVVMRWVILLCIFLA